MIKLTANAAKQVQLQAKEGNMEGMALRIAAKQDDTGAFEYGIGFDQPAEDDVRVTSEGVEVLIAPAHAALLKDVVMDYAEIEPGTFHFIFLNPNDPNYVPPKEPN